MTWGGPDGDSVLHEYRTDPDVGGVTVGRAGSTECRRTGGFVSANVWRLRFVIFEVKKMSSHAQGPYDRTTDLEAEERTTVLSMDTGESQNKLADDIINLKGYPTCPVPIFHGKSWQSCQDNTLYF
eukprot:758357-Hanusia_phi.AAC.3